MTTSPPAPAAAQDSPGSTPAAWTPSALGVLWLCGGLSLFLRLFFLSADALTEDEARTWSRMLAGGPELAGRLELRALLAAPAASLGRALGFSPESVLRGGPALASAVAALLAALLARRLSGGLAGLLAAALFTVSPALLGADRAGGVLPLVTTLSLLLCLCAVEVHARAHAGRGSGEARSRTLWLAGAATSCLALGVLGRFGALALLFPLALLLAGTPRAALRSAGPLAAAAGAALLGPRLLVSADAPCEFLWRGVLYAEYGEPAPPLLHLALAAVKLSPGTLLLALAGLALAVLAGTWQRRLAAGWLLLAAALLVLAHPVSPGDFVVLLPPLLLLAAAAGAAAVEWARGPGTTPTRASAVALLCCALAGPGAEAFAAVSTGPHPRLWLSPLAGDAATALLAWSPSSDLGTTGLREAAQELAARAEPNAEVASASPEALRLSFSAAGRDDLSIKLLRRGQPCRAGRICYVVLQEGLLDSSNRDAARALSRRAPWQVERLLGVEAVRVHRLLPGESPFPDENQPR